MTDGPISTPRRPAPRSIGTPMILTFLTMTRTSVGPRPAALSALFSHYGSGNGKKGLGPPGRLSDLSSVSTPKKVLSGNRIRHAFYQPPDIQLELVQIRWFDHITLSPGCQPGLDIRTIGGGGIKQDRSCLIKSADFAAQLDPAHVRQPRIQ